MDHLQKMLASLDGRLTPVLRRYDRNCLKEETIAEADQQVSFGGAQWQSAVNVSENKVGDTGYLELEVTFKVVSGSIDSAGVGVAFEFAGWQDDNYTMLPCAVYNGNDFDTYDTSYPPMWKDTSQFRPDMPSTTTPVPQLSKDSARIEQTTGDTSVPCMGFYSPSQKQGFLLFAEQGSRFGNHGLTVERCGEGSCRFLVNAPSVREFHHNHCKKPTPSDDRGVAWSEGDEIILKLVIAAFEAPQLQVLFDRFCDLRKCSLYTSEPRCELPYSAGWKIIEEKYNRDNWVEEDGFYKLAPNFHTTFETANKPLCFLWQIGWVGGGIMTLPMLAQGSAETRARAMRNLEMIFEKTQAPSGFFMGLGDGQKFYSDGVDTPYKHNLHMVRKSGDWLYFGIKQLDLLMKQGVEVPESWNNALKKLADAFVRLWEQSGQFGQWVDIESGELLIGGSASGGIIPGALVLASEFFNDNRYLQVAEASARKYYQDFVLKGITTGGPGEILSAPDSEAAFALVESFVALLEKTGSTEWAKAAKAMVRQAATWVVSYDYTFPADSSLGQDDARSTGAVWANIQNKHGAPGICTFSGDSLFRLWRLTGDQVALDLIKDIAHGIPQYLSRADRPLSSHMQPGWMCERVNLSDWEGPDGVGGSLFGSSSWPETAFMLTTLEIPGIYIQPDTGHVTVFDNIELESLEHEGAAVTLNLYNPTSFDAEVKVLVESARNAKDALTLNANQSWQVVSIPKGARLQLKSDSLNIIPKNNKAE